MQNTPRHHKNTGSTVLTPTMVGIVTLLITVSLFYLFLLRLQRATPYLWPYATTVVPKQAFSITQKPRNNNNIDRQSRHSAVYTLMFQQQEIVFSEPAQSGGCIEEQLSPKGPIYYLGTICYGQTKHKFKYTSVLELAPKNWLVVGGIKHFTPFIEEKLEIPAGLAISSTWIGSEPREKEHYSHILKSGPNMVFPRAMPHLMLLKNKNVLVSGGIGEYKKALLGCNGFPVQSIEEYDCQQKKFTSLGQMQIPRYGHATCQLYDGNILIVCGRTNAKLSDSLTDLTSTIEVFSPQTKTSIIVGQLHRAMANPILIPLKDGKVFIVDNHTLYSGRDMQPYAELYENNRLPVQKLPHMPSVAEIVHTLWHWKD